VATPFLVLSSPLLGKYLSHQAFHWIVALVIFPVAVYALQSGYKLHRNRQMAIFGCIGVSLMMAGLWAGFWNDQKTLETLFMISAGIFLVIAHAMNLRACRIKIAPGQPSRRHDHSFGAKAHHAEPGTQAHENA